MLYYIALIWDTTNAEENVTARRLLQKFLAQSPCWHIATDIDGLVVCYSSSGTDAIDSIYVLQNRRGVILGRLFDQNYESGNVPTRVEFDDKGSAKLIACGGRDLIRRYWGHYIAFLRDELSQRTWVLRDPTGGIPCYVTKVHGINVYFRRLQDCSRLGTLRLSVDRRYLVASVGYGVSLNRLTGFTQITVLLAGECAEHHKNQLKSSFYWDPMNIAVNDVIEDPAQAMQLMKKTVRSCVHAWASCWNGILHFLSGGLDSSIVLSCLVDAPTHPLIVCENRFARSGSRQDERRFARLVAQHVRCELIERSREDDLYFRVPDALPQSPEPSYFGEIWEAKTGLTDRMQSRGLSVTFTGNSGDELFFTHGPLPTAADYMHRHGLCATSLRIVAEDAYLDEVSVFRVMRKAIRHGVLKRPWNYRTDFLDRWRRTHVRDDAVPNDVREEAFRDELLAHPLYIHGNERVPPGKIYQCVLITLAADQRDAPWPTDLAPPLPKVAPLYSQPLIELSLRIPLYVLRFGGRDRAIARMAFAEEIPSEIIQRRSKGGGNESYQISLSRNIDFVRKLLLDGLLVQNGYLDGRVLDEVLHLESPTRRKTSVVNILRYLMIEVWYRNATKMAR